MTLVVKLPFQIQILFNTHLDTPTFIWHMASSAYIYILFHLFTAFTFLILHTSQHCASRFSPNEHIIRSPFGPSFPRKVRALSVCVCSANALTISAIRLAASEASPLFGLNMRRRRCVAPNFPENKHSVVPPVRTSDDNVEPRVNRFECTTCQRCVCVCVRRKIGGTSHDY